ncbi:MAG: CPBP family intramembrane metalloprotease [Cellulomonas iranensis]|uniref:CPBP family intramembrane glutamic endopeptidase n=1 Tax=Cellulomonas iranensis TaxID=76862 RepID=UPI001B1713B4|nr:CPBP family intramembrane glutamic endopeptidase [Cellulomonas iranensis]MBO9568369.1 CPBP family intramembrane metalloprotease [Cellulomonas iranensis]
MRDTRATPADHPVPADHAASAGHAVPADHAVPAGGPGPGGLPPGVGPTAGRPLLPRTGAALAAAGAALAVGALGALLVLAPHGLRASADAGAPTVPYAHVLLPALVAVALVRLLPPRAPVLSPVVRDARRVLLGTAGLLACTVVFPVAVALTGVGDRPEYHLVKLVLVVAVPALVVAVTRGGLERAWPRGAWRWWAPAVVVLGWTALAQAAPWVAHPRYDDVPVDLLVTAAVATAVTAGVGEELLYRVWLQTRLEALLGRWGGIAVATLAFALLHVGTRQGQGPVVEVGAALVVQGLGFGLVAGYLWSRYRNPWLLVALHVLANGYGVLVVLLG